MRRAARHYCQNCKADFLVNLHEEETGGVILICPTCSAEHYRMFMNGVATNDDPATSTEKPTRFLGRKIRACGRV